MATQKKETLAPSAETPAKETKVSGAKKLSAKATPKATAAKKESARKSKRGTRTAKPRASKASQLMTTPPETEAVPQPTAQMASTLAAADEVGHASENPASVDGDDLMTADPMTKDIWVPGAAIPSIDEATYKVRKEQAEGQRRAIEVASLNLKNMNDLHQLEGQKINVAISAKTNETQNAKLAGVDIEYQTQLQVNGEKSQQLAQASAKHDSAARETGYTEQLLNLKDQNFELEVQQAQNVFAEKASRYRAQLAGQ